MLSGRRIREWVRSAVKCEARRHERARARERESLHEALREHALQPTDLERRERAPQKSAKLQTTRCTTLPTRRLTSSTLSAPSIAVLTLSFSSLLNNLPALPADAAAGSTPGSNVLVPLATREGAEAAPLEAEAEAKVTARGVGVPSEVRKRLCARVRSCVVSNGG